MNPPKRNSQNKLKKHTKHTLKHVVGCKQW